MFASWGALVFRGRWIVIAVVLGVTVLGGAWGLGVFGTLHQGGYTDPASRSSQAAALAERTFGRQAGDVVVVYTAPPGHTVAEPDVAAAARRVLRSLPAGAARFVVSYWDSGSSALVTPDRRHALVSITLTDPAEYPTIRHRLDIPGLTAQVGGQVPVQTATSDRSKSDLTRAEAVSLPITLVLLVVLFGSVVAAALPVLVGVLAILGSLGVLRLISLGVDVNSFAPNVVSLLGLGLAIDYGLFTVGRFREELATGADVADAVARTVATSGRTVAFSATLLVIALAGLLVFPIDFLRSLAYGGMSAVAIAALVSVTLLPALLGVLGHRVDRLAVPWRRSAGESTWLRRLAGVVLRRPVAFVLPILAVLLLLGAPFLSVRFGAADEKQLPPGDPTRQAAQAIGTYFPGSGDNAAQIVLRGPGDPQRFLVRAGKVPGVATVLRGPTRDGVTVLNATLVGDPLGDEAENAVRALRALPAPAHTEVLVGGFAATVVDSVKSIVDRVPLMVGILVAATLALMFLAFGSVLLPIKAVLMSTLSLGATFGVLVAVFQLGHGAGLLGVTPEPVQPGMIVLIGAVVFGLSTDYETFLLSRMVEAHRAGATTRDAIRTGLVATGRTISSAALLLIVVTGAFALSPLATMRFLGVGMIVALLLDATVVRLLLVPAVLRLLGESAWWAPRSGHRGRHGPGPGPHDQPLHTERHRDVEQQRGRRQARGRTTVVDQQADTEVHADRDHPQRQGQRVALPVEHSVVPPQPDGVGAHRTEAARQHQAGQQHRDPGAVHRVVADEPDELDHTDDE
ncbi:MAG TPA: MMPL family transporter [Pseudonocardiaceae bacterium]|nr:MMPL family transporter [Pseudonocardiaceae bacterium]